MTGLPIPYGTFSERGISTFAPTNFEEYLHFSQENELYDTYKATTRLISSILQCEDEDITFCNKGINAVARTLKNYKFKEDEKVIISKQIWEKLDNITFMSSFMKKFADKVIIWDHSDYICQEDVNKIDGCKMVVMEAPLNKSDAIEFAQDIFTVIDATNLVGYSDISTLSANVIVADLDHWLAQDVAFVFVDYNYQKTIYDQKLAERSFIADRLNFVPKLKIFTDLWSNAITDIAKNRAYILELTTTSKKYLEATIDSCKVDICGPIIWFQSSNSEHRAMLRVSPFHEVDHVIIWAKNSYNITHISDGIQGCTETNASEILDIVG